MVTSIGIEKHSLSLATILIIVLSVVFGIAVIEQVATCRVAREAFVLGESRVDTTRLGADLDLDCR